MTPIVFSVFFAALSVVESNGDPTKVGAAGEIGIYQISDICRKDVNRIYHAGYTPDDLKDPEKARAVCLLYLTHYAELFRRTHRRDPDVAELARIWNAGPYGATAACSAQYGRRFASVYLNLIARYYRALAEWEMTPEEAVNYLNRHFGDV